jgi:hypothetical protein
MDQHRMNLRFSLTPKPSRGLYWATTDINEAEQTCDEKSESTPELTVKKVCGHQYI